MAPFPKSHFLETTVVSLASVKQIVVGLQPPVADMVNFACLYFIPLSRFVAEHPLVSLTHNEIVSDVGGA